MEVAIGRRALALWPEIHRRVKAVTDFFTFFVGYVARRPLALLGYLIVVGAVLAALFAPFIATHDPTTASSDVLESPSSHHLFGTDLSGFDIFSRVVYAFRTDLQIGVTAAALALFIGSPLGVVAGYSRGPAGALIGRISDIVQAFPIFILAMAIVAARGPSITNVIFVVALLNAPIYLRLMRSETLGVRERTYIEAAKALGNSDLQIVRRHLIRNTMTPALIQFSVNIGWAVLLTASLSFVGAGVRIPTAEWGAMIAVGAQNMITGEWWPSVMPGIALGLTVFGFAVVGDTLEELFSPERR